VTAGILEQQVERLHAALSAGEPDLLAARTTWNLSQTLQHCAQTITYSTSGYPRLKPAVYRATIGALVKRLFLATGSMRHPLDAEIDGAPPLASGMELGEALELLKAAVAGFGAYTDPHPPHPVYGACTHQEFERLHAMHLAEHLPGLPVP
jgi:hypothetical protein